MIDHPTQLTPVFELMEQEIASYEALLSDLKQEWEYLRRNDTSSMVSLLQIKEAHMGQIKMIQGSMDQILKEAFGHTSCKDISVSLTQLIPQGSSPQVKKIRHYQNTLLALKRQIQQVNERNKCFIQETLRHLRDLLSLFIYPVQEESVYAKRGIREPACPASSWISKEV